MEWWQRVEEVLDDHRRDVRLIVPRLQVVEAELRPSVTERQTLFSRVEQIAENIEDPYLNHTWRSSDVG